MTQPTISLEERARNALVKVQEFERGAVLAGGFLRDMDNGVQPKDLDFFLTAPEVDTEGFAKSIFDSFGHTFKLLGREGEDYPMGLMVFDSFTYPVGDFPINLIFTPYGHRHPLAFDIGLCEIYLLRPGDPLFKSRNYMRDQENNTLTITAVADSYASQQGLIQESQSIPCHIKHLKRLTEKYPTHKVVVSSGLIMKSYFSKLLRKLYEEQLLENTREILPTPRRIPSRNQFRLQDRAEALRGLNLPFGGGGLELETRVHSVFDRPQVQPGRITGVWFDEADLRGD